MSTINENMGAQHKITGTLPGSGDVPIGGRTGVVQSIAVSTDWQAIENAFASRNAQREVRSTDDSQGGME